MDESSLLLLRWETRLRGELGQSLIILFAIQEMPIDSESVMRVTW
jgi:hypothetical protein